MNRSLQMLIAAASIPFATTVGYQYYSHKQSMALTADVEKCLQEVVRLGDFDSGLGDPYGDSRPVIAFTVRQCKIRARRDEVFRRALIVNIDATPSR